MLRRTAERKECSTGPLLESLLDPYFSVDVARFDADMPGFSGSAAIAVLTLGHTREVRRRLRLAETFLISWHESSGLNACASALDDKERDSDEARRLGQGPRRRRHSSYRAWFLLDAPHAGQHERALVDVQ